jgi:hypothetical protein
MHKTMPLNLGLHMISSKLDEVKAWLGGSKVVFESS